MSKREKDSYPHNVESDNGIDNKYILDDDHSDETNPSIDETSDDISTFLAKIKNKYSGNADQKHLNQMYDVGILMTNKKINRDKLIRKLTKIIEDRSYDTIKRVRDSKRELLMEALKRGIDDGQSDEYRKAYDSANKYQYNDREKLKKRAHIDGLMDTFNSFKHSV